MNADGAAFGACSTRAICAQASHSCVRDARTPQTIGRFTDASVSRLDDGEPMSENRGAKKLTGERSAVGREAPIVVTPSGLARLVAQTAALIRRRASRTR
jgi:hypothetical protein